MNVKLHVDDVDVVDVGKKGKGEENEVEQEEDLQIEDDDDEDDDFVAVFDVYAKDRNHKKGNRKEDALRIGCGASSGSPYISS